MNDMTYLKGAAAAGLFTHTIENLVLFVGPATTTKTLWPFLTTRRTTAKKDGVSYIATQPKKVGSTNHIRGLAHRLAR